MEQGSPEWLEARRGIPTASRFSEIVTSKGKPSTGQAGYIYDLIVEECTGTPKSVRQTAAMKHGHDFEPVARDIYREERLSFEPDAPEVEVGEVGFVVHQELGVGCSPDSLVREDGELVGGLEIKCPDSRTFTKYVLDGAHCPTEYLPQVHGSMIVCGVRWWDVIIYDPRLGDHYIDRVHWCGLTNEIFAQLGAFSKKYRAQLQKYQDWREGES